MCRNMYYPREVCHSVGEEKVVNQRELVQGAILKVRDRKFFESQNYNIHGDYLLAAFP